MVAPTAFFVAVFIDDANLPNLGRRYRVSGDGTTLGNLPEVDIPLPLEKSSVCYVRVYIHNGVWHLTDLAEFSQVSVNNLLVQKSQLFDGDILKIGPLGLEFCSEEGKKFRYFEQIENLLQEDFLTRAYNRSFLFNLLRIEVVRYHRSLANFRINKEAPPASEVSLLFMDVDHFGEVNKKYGHAAGDEVLRELVRRIKQRLRSIDIIARYGGEEFVVVLFDTPHEQAVAVAENIRTLIADTPFKIAHEREVSVTISMGISELQNGMEVNEFLQVADEHVRTAKKQGRNRCIG